MADRGWPIYPSAQNPYFGDGVTYGRELGRVSPKGNIFGQIRFAREWIHKVVWDGHQYRDVEADGLAQSYEELPRSIRPFMEIWAVKLSSGKVDLYYQEDGTWMKLQWLWTAVDGLTALPYPGQFVGACHVVLEEDVLVYWNGFDWYRLRHSSLDNDEPQLHLPLGFFNLFIPDVQIRWISKRELALEAVEGGSGKVMVGTEQIYAGTSCSVFSGCPVLLWDAVNRTVFASYIEPETEYWIYLANRLSAAFSVDALPGDETHNTTAAWDFRGRLFLSPKAPENDYLAEAGAGVNARLAGKIQTDATPASEGGPFFLRELDISLISRDASFSQAFRDYSDFYVAFVDQDTLELRRLDGAYGQMYIPAGLVYLREGGLVYSDDPVIELDENGAPLLNTSPTRANRLWFLYIANSMDQFNFNAVNDDTGRPWMPNDVDADTNYDADLDYRLRPFLSPVTPDHGRLTETYPGFYSRHIGQVSTDDNGRFINASDLSSIRQPVFNPAYLDGLAEIQLVSIATSEFRIARAKGTSGIVLVRGQAVQTYENDNEAVFKLRNTDAVQTYTEADINAPLTAGDAVSESASSVLYVYMANGMPCWGDLANQPFWSDQAPVAGYLSRNWPGNNARWICSVAVDARGEFTGSYLVDAVAMNAPAIDDGSVSMNALWSSARIMAEINKVMLEISKSAVWETQKTLGLAVRLEYSDTTHIKLVAASYEDITVVLPDASTTVEVSLSGISLSVSGTPATLYYVYLSESGLILSTDAPTATYDNLQAKDNTILVGVLCMTSTNTMSGAWNVCSFYNEPSRQWTYSLPTSISGALSVENLFPGLVATSNALASISRTGTTEAFAYNTWFNRFSPPYTEAQLLAAGALCHSSVGTGTGGCTATAINSSIGKVEVTVSLSILVTPASLTDGLSEGISYTEELSGSAREDYYLNGNWVPWTSYEYGLNSRTGEIVVQRGPA